MKKDIHPKYGPAVIKCACGNKVETRSTVKELNIEICSACHPFYTGKSKLVDSTGRVDRFMKRFNKSAKLKAALKSKKGEKSTAKADSKKTVKDKKEAKTATAKTKTPTPAKQK